MKPLLLFTSLLLLSSAALAQAEPFAPGLLPYGAFGLSVSPDGREAFFVHSNGGRDTMQLYHMVKRGRRWTRPRPWAHADGAQRQIDPAFSPDGQHLLLNINGPGTRSFDIFISHRRDTGWSRPEPIAALNSDSSDFYATMARSGNIYFTRRLHNSNDIWMSRFENGAYTAPVPLDSSLNSSGNETNPFIDPDERYLLLLCDRPGGAGSGDLHIARRRGNGWAPAENLGPAVNTPVSEFCPSVHPGSRRFYFSRTQVLPGGRRIESIYSIPLRKLPALRRS
ncbi:hypothetical protein [Flaviaesturariibacter amylovorans]|uniref:Exo-alpha-sialidase n=1 Tax=Flaviaesturariibacter amylovorans TaxID=1084520 RepID=A0ABP8H8R4_9BACT